MDQIVFFKDREFERAVRDTLISSKVSMVDRREKALDGIIWKRDLERVQSVSINFRKYKIRDISDLVYFKNAKLISLVYSSAYYGDKSIYEDENVLDNLYKIKDLKYLDDLQLYHLKLDDEAIENIKKMFPNARVVIE